MTTFVVGRRDAEVEILRRVRHARSARRTIATQDDREKKRGVESGEWNPRAHSHKTRGGAPKEEHRLKPVGRNGLRRAGETERALVGGKSGGDAVVNFVDERFAIVERIF